MADSRVPRDSGFTLLEVLMATLLFALAFGTMIQAVSSYLRVLGTTRDQMVASELGQGTLRDVATRVEQGEEIESETGSYEEEFDYMRYELRVEPYTVPIPDGVDLDPTVPVASVFTPLSVNANTPDSPLRRIEVRVYPEGQDPAAAQPLLAIVSLPIEPTATPESPDPGGANPQGNPFDAADTPR